MGTERRLDAAGFDVTDEPPARPHRVPMAVAGVVSALAIVGAVGAVAVGRSDRVSDGVARARDAVVLTSLGREVHGDDHAASAVLPQVQAALSGRAGRPVGLAPSGVDVVPPRVLQSYRSAETTLARESADCHLPWWVLAGIGKVQSNHAAGGRVDASGRATVRIVGPRLDGTVVDGALVRDTDGGRLDGDMTFDRGTGPMLVLPATWGRIGRAADTSRQPDIENADDAALTIGTLLCSARTDLTTPEGLAAGLVRMDDAPTFASDVLPWIAYYRASAPQGTPAAGVATASTGASRSSAVGVAPASPATGSDAATGASGRGGQAVSSASATALAGPGFTTQPTTAPPSTTPPPVPRPAHPRRPAGPATVPTSTGSTTRRATSESRPVAPGVPAPRPSERPTATPRPRDTEPSPRDTPTPSPGRPEPARPPAPRDTDPPRAPEPSESAAPRPADPVEGPPGQRDREDRTVRARSREGRPGVGPRDDSGASGGGQGRGRGQDPGENSTALP